MPFTSCRRNIACRSATSTRVGYGACCFDDCPRLDEAEGASHDDREERVGAAVRLDDAVVEILQADIAALALVLERGVMHVRERHGEIVRHAFRHAALSDLIGDAVEDDELAVEPFAGSDAGVAVGEQFADGRGAFEQSGHQQRQRAVLVQLVGVMRRDGFDLCSLRFCHGDYDNAARGALQRGLHIGERLRCDLPHEQHSHLIPPKSHLRPLKWDYGRGGSRIGRGRRIAAMPGEDR